VKRWSAVIVLSFVVLSLMVSPALAQRGDKIANDAPDSTTLDACGYFVGVETPIQTKQYVADGVTYRSEMGTWTGVSNNYGGGPVASLGAVDGTYRLETATDANDIVTGSESFHSSVGKIDQTFVLNFASNSYVVSVVATKELSFLTSDTDGACYGGPFPRP